MALRETIPWSHESSLKIAPDINIYLTNVITIQEKTRYSQILIIAKTLKALDLLLKKFLLGIVTKKHPRGASIHEIKESFPLKPSLKTKYWYKVCFMLLFFFLKKYIFFKIPCLPISYIDA